ncbi:hypothetical protein BpHYR1_017328 [Brachionus plicatilis]|uniref:Uncharacterized protein n=1 Tax=Brachionus plicatilis TaxID=10195 RepID=A0A3M7Q1K1_BRAPC|nr:hypothetical protein BpHYR1_017328 [Brachionus plicatilis]
MLLLVVYISSQINRLDLKIFIIQNLRTIDIFFQLIFTIKFFLIIQHKQGQNIFGNFNNFHFIGQHSAVDCLRPSSIRVTSLVNCDILSWFLARTLSGTRVP